MYEPTSASRTALFRLSTISLMDEMVPFLGLLAASFRVEEGVAHLEVAADEELASHFDGIGGN